MKLYTEEMVKRAISLTLDSPTHSNLVLDHLTPIELPNNEEIEELSRQINYGGGSMGWIKDAFKKGAKSVIDKIKNQQQ